MSEGKILVLAATGNVGAPLVAELLRLGEKVRAATRSAASTTAGAEAVRLDLADPRTLAAALEGVDRIFALSPTGYLDPVGMLGPVVDEAAARNIKIVLQTAFGVDANDAIPLRQLELKLERSGAPYVILRPNWFSDNFATYWANGVRRGEIRVPAGEGTTSFIDARDVAASAAGALTTNRHDGKAFALTGPAAYSYADAARLLADALGRPVRYSPIDNSTFVAEAVAGGLMPGYAELLAAIFHPVAEGWTSGVTDAVGLLSGKPPRSLEQSIAEIAARLNA
ncbi:SDR family oxidoreductase [Aminobacter anthyllidis]|nr:SDR family oxidoreductase [Aminobacter anthyllidis]